MARRLWTPRVGVRLATLCVLLGCLGSAGLADAARAPQTFFVDVDGDDGDDGDARSPFATIQRGLDAADVPGDTVFVAGGEYVEAITFPHDGRRGRPITLRGDPHDRPTLRFPANQTERWCHVEIRDRRFVEMQGLRVRGFRSEALSAAILVVGSSEGVVLADNVLHDIRPSQGYEGEVCGIAIYSTGNGQHRRPVVVGNEIFDVMTGYSEVISLNGRVTDFVVERNVVRHNHCNPVIHAAGLYYEDGTGMILLGDRQKPERERERVDGVGAGPGVFRGNVVFGNLDPNRGGIGIYVNGAKGILVEGNLVSDNHVGISVMAENPTLVTSDVAVVNNVVANQQGWGIVVGSGGADGGKLNSGRVENVRVVHNTLVNNGHTRRWSGGASVEVAAVDGLLLARNLIVPAGQGEGAGVAVRFSQPPKNARIDHNAFGTDLLGDMPLTFGLPAGRTLEGIDAWRSRTAFGDRSVVGNARFRAPEAQDYRLRDDTVAATVPVRSVPVAAAAYDLLGLPRNADDADGVAAGAYILQRGRADAPAEL